MFNIQVQITCMQPKIKQQAMTSFKIDSLQRQLDFFFQLKQVNQIKTIS